MSCARLGMVSGRGLAEVIRRRYPPWVLWPACALLVIAPKREDIAAIPEEKRPYYILQERMHFEPVIETPFGGTKAEVRVMYVWLNELTPVLTIIRTGRGLQMGVDHNKNMEWVGASAALYLDE